MRRGKCCGSSLNIRSMGSRASQCAQIAKHVAEFPDQLGVAEFAGRRIPCSAQNAIAGEKQTKETAAKKPAAKSQRKSA